jgi:hypothetical protein
MSGYLTNLLRRTFDPSVAMVQPRLSTLFAPPERNLAGPASGFTEQEPKSIEELTGPGEQLSVLNNPLPGPLPRAARLAPTELSLPLKAALPPSLPEMHPSSFASRHGEHTEVSPPVQSGRVEHRSESANLLQATAAPQMESDGQISPVSAAAKTSRENSDIATRKPFVRARRELTTKLARSLGRSAKAEVSPPLMDQSRPEPGKSPRVRVEEVTPDRPRVPDPIGPAEMGARLSGPELLASKTEVHRVLPAFPLSAVENQGPARSGEAMSATAMPGRGPLSVRPTDFREVVRRSADPPEPTIEVTIGRIEVRGSPTETRRVPATPLPGLSLDAYLRRRSGWGSE